MRYRNVKTGLTVITTGAVTGEDWVADDLKRKDEGEDGGKSEEAPKTPKGKSRSKKAGEE